MTTVDRPLKLGELLAETVRIYGERIWASLGIGAVVAGAALAAHVVPDAAAIAIISLVFTVAFAAASRLVSGDGFEEAWAQVALRLPVLLVLGFVVAVPFTLGRIDPILLVFGVAWLALVGLSIPVAMIEREAGARGALERLGFSLRRGLTLARTEYFHAMGVSAALVVIYLVFGVLLAALLSGFADNGSVVAGALAQMVLAPFFFLGLSVLYFDQRARTEVAPGKTRRAA